MNVETIIRDVENRDLVLPEFQRDFVWKEDDIKKFIQSLYKNYPTGSLLIWKTLKPPKLRGDHKPADNVYTRVLLDGQQRLTTLYLFIKGKTPPYYTNQIKKFNLFFNIETEEFRYYQKSIMEGKIEWLSLINFFQQESAALFIQKSSNPDYYFKFLVQLTNLEKIKKYDYYIDEEKLGSLNDIKEVVRIFNLVNKQGRSLFEEDLALAHVSVFWPEIKDLFRIELSLYKQLGFVFDFNFLIMCLNASTTGHAKFEGFYHMSEKEIKDSWEKVKKALIYLLNIIRDKAYIDSTANYELKSEALLVPLVVYLANNNCEFKNEKEQNKFLFWFYNALMWGRYTRRGKSSPLEQDVVTITREKSPESLIHNFEREVRYFDVKPDNLEGASVTSPFFNMTFIVAKSKGAIDWFTGNNLHTKLIGQSYKLHKHHIFPKDFLRKKGIYTKENKKSVNEIANRAFLTEKANLKIRNSEPNDYLNEVIKKYPKSLSQQFVTEKAELWKVENFEDFLKDRRIKIASEINIFMKSLVDGDIPRIDLNDLIKQDESYNLEFKSTYSWDINNNQVNKELKFTVLKSIVGFMNANGGTLLIGVDDNHNVIGMEFDYKSNWKGNKDGFSLDFCKMIEEAIGITNYKKYINLSFAKIENKEICCIKIEKGLEPIFLKRNGKNVLYVRLENKIEPLDDPKEINKYIAENWE